MIIIEELAYSFHLGSDKNKKNGIRNISKNNKSNSTSLSNNAIQNLRTLSKVDKHNYRKYDEDTNNIEIIKGSNNIINDVKELYLKEFENARLEYNSKQVRDDRKINDYLTHISNNDKTDLACEIIIELGDKKYWDTKDINFKKRMTSVYSKQINDLENNVPSFKITSAIIHYDETSPHLHIVGVPIKSGNKNGMSKQVGKTSVFTKESLKIIQDKMRVLCIESYNNEYGLNNSLKQKLKGRNKDIHVSDMGNYQQLKNELEKNQEKLKYFSNNSKNLKSNSNEIDSIMKNLKQSKISKSTYLLSNEEKEKIKNYIDNVKLTNKDFEEMCILSITLSNAKEQMNTYQNTIKELQDNNRALNIRNNELIKKNAEQEDKIDKLEEENYSLKIMVNSLKKKFIKLKNFLHEKLFGWGKKDSTYNKVVDDLYDKDILNDKDMKDIEKGNYEL